MADPQSGHDLKYGQFGLCYYNPDDHAWLWTRRLGAAYTIQPVGSPILAVKGAAHGDAPTMPGTEPTKSLPPHRAQKEQRPSRRLRSQVPAIVRRVPTLASGSGAGAGLQLVDEHAHLSAETSAASARHDATLGELLQFGQLYDEATKRPMHVAAFPAASDNTILRLMQVQLQKQGWQDSKSIWIDVPKIDGESGAWSASAPIRQLCFFRSSDSDITSTLAVRTATTISMLRVTLGKHARSWDSVVRSPSRFETTVLFNLDLGILAGFPPSDVTYNPWYPRQFATIDQHGTWRIWDMTSAKHAHALASHERGRPHETAFGAISGHALSSSVESAAIAEGRILDDGWARVCWAGNESTVVVASRRHIGVYDVQGKPVILHAPSLGIDGTSFWILDLLSDPVTHSVVFVLTSEKLFCLRVRTLDMSDAKSYDLAGAYVLFECRHFRDPEDISLRLLVTKHEDDIVVLVRSSLMQDATAYRFKFVNTSSEPLLTVSDATLIQLPDVPGHRWGSVGLAVQEAPYGENARRDPSGPGVEYRNKSIRFVVFTRLTNDLSVIQNIYHTRPFDHFSGTVLPVQWQSRLTHGAPRLMKSGFVVDDAPSGGHVPERQPSSLLRRQNRRSDWSMLYTQAHAALSRPTLEHVQDVTTILDLVQEQLQISDEPDERRLTVLSTLGVGELAVRDLDETTIRFRQLLRLPGDDHLLADENERSQRSQITCLTTSWQIWGMSLSDGTGVDPAAIYHEIIENWLTPLSMRVPGRVRVTKEQLARRVAGEICLASHALVPPHAVTTNDDSQELPVASSPRRGETEFHSSLPTPSPTVTTATTLSSHPSTLVAPEFARLRRYVTFTEDNDTLGAPPTPAPLPKSLANRLAHWTLGADPEKYDWLATQREQQKRADEENEDLTPRERARLKRRAERHLRKQRHETTKALMAGLASSQAPEIVSTTATPIGSRVSSQPARTGEARRARLSFSGGGGSQPLTSASAYTAPTSVVRSTGAVQSQGLALPSSSQDVHTQTQGLLSTLPSTQVEPGRFGGRGAPKKKKRKRDVGF